MLSYLTTFCVFLSVSTCRSADACCQMQPKLGLHLAEGLTATRLADFLLLKSIKNYFEMIDSGNKPLLTCNWARLSSSVRATMQEINPAFYKLHCSSNYTRNFFLSKGARLLKVKTFYMVSIPY